ncbi:hypothetical protein F4781DRAFT_416524 [Annulohypoxylon bovei var. microspora]|nr:hypothetical protein F4781DRAFT_416524 [Annulohypoxylon bovei var. microspora]
MSVELGLAIFAAIDLCVKYGKELEKIRSAFKGAETEIKERILRLENGCYRCISQLQFLEQAQTHHTMSDDHRALHKRTLHMLIEKLNVAEAILRGLVDTQIDYNSLGNELIYVPKPLKYAFKKGSLDEAIDALETWQRISDPSWFLILKISDSWIDDTLTNTSGVTKYIPSASAIRVGSRKASSMNNDSTRLALPATDLNQMTTNQIIFSDVKIAASVRSDKTITYILDRIGSTETGLEVNTKRNIRDLARRLQHDEPQTFGLLACKGFVEENTNPFIFETPTDFTLIFRTPPRSTDPRSLRGHLLYGRPNSLSQRFSIAQQLAKSVTYVHVFGFVHKNVRPENIIEFSEQGNENLSVFLVGFKDLRREEGRTQRYGDDTPEKNLYRHPTRQGIIPGSEFIMQHDIYSLGICLLEIGLWQSFVQYDVQNQNPRLSAMFGVAYNAPMEQVARFLLISAKEWFVELARSKLRECMGTRYSEIVETCLTCLDPDNADFGDPREFEDEDGIRVGVRYIEKVLQCLDALCV